VEIAKACFEHNAEALYEAFSKDLLQDLLRGNVYAFKELADRAFGKLKETHQVDVSPYKDVPAEDLAKEIKRLEVQLGYAKPEKLSQRRCFRQSANRSQIILWPDSQSAVPV